EFLSQSSLFLFCVQRQCPTLISFIVGRDYFTDFDSFKGGLIYQESLISPWTMRKIKGGDK
ncbi:hypothetical protein Leryth_019809, partial [Lithospermum erythrorhizon]